jgi:1-acylglycerone phosphate reductase
MPILDSDLQKGRDLYDVNVFGVIAVTQAFFPLLRNAKGMVANIGSIIGVGALAPYQGLHLLLFPPPLFSPLRETSIA